MHQISHDTQNTIKHFFISYNRADSAWAEWIAWQLEKKGYTTVIQVWDFRPGSSFVHNMDKAMQETQRTIIILSPHFLYAPYTQSEWEDAFRRDPKGEQGILIPVRVQECKPQGLLGRIVYIDLVGLDEPTALTTLLAGVALGRAKPVLQPHFPDKTLQTSVEEPYFPGDKSTQGENQEEICEPEILPLQRHHIQKFHWKKISPFVLIALTILLFAVVVQPLWHSMPLSLISEPATSTNQKSDNNSPLEMSLRAIQSHFWVIPGNTTQYSLSNLPEKHIGALYTDGHTSAPLYYLYFEVHNLSRESSNINIEEVKLIIQQVRPMPHPVSVWANGVSTMYESTHKYEALYLGQENGSTVADYINPDYVTHKFGIVTLSPGETDTMEVHLISRVEADLFFSVQVTYFFGSESHSHILKLPAQFEVMFVNRSEWRFYQLKYGRLVASS